MSFLKWNNYLKSGLAVSVILFMSGSSLNTVEAAKTKYPASAPHNGARILFTDEDSDLVDYVIDLAPRGGRKEYDYGSWYVYGNKQNDENGVNSFENLKFEFDGDFPEKFALISVDTSVTNDPEYKVLAIKGTTVGTGTTFTNAYELTQSNDAPRLSTNVLRSLYEDAIDQSALASSAYTKGTNTFEVDAFTEKSNNSNQYYGDPDILHKHYDELYVYISYGTNAESAFRIDIDLGMARQNATTLEVSSIQAEKRGKISRLSFGLPKVMDGVADFEVEIFGSSQGDYNYVTKNPVIFFPTEFGDDIDISVYTRNTEGTTSKGVQINNSEVERYLIDDKLTDIEVDDTDFRDYIIYLYKLGIIDGYKGTYMPKETINRGAMAKFVMNAFRIPFNISGDRFPDVPESNVFFPYIQSLKNAGIVDGTSAGLYLPDGYMDRGSVTKFIVNAARFYDDDSIGDGTCSFDDENDVVFKTFDEYICALANFGDENHQRIVKGYTSGDFGAKDKLDRQAMAKIILNSASMIPVYSANPKKSFIHNFFGISETNFPRPFVAPIELSNKDVIEPTASSLKVVWDDLSTSDSAIDGYLIDRKLSSDSERAWTGISVNDVKQLITVNIGGTIEADDIFTVTVNGVKTTNVTGANSTTVASNLKTAIGALAQPVSVTSGTGSVLIEANTAGTGFSYEVNTTETGGTTKDSQTIQAVMTRSNSNANEFGVILAPAANYIDTGLTSDKKYDYRVAAFKFIPYEFAEESYTNQADMEKEANYEFRENMVIGIWGDEIGLSTE